MEAGAEPPRPPSPTSRGGPARAAGRELAGDCGRGGTHTSARRELMTTQPSRNLAILIFDDVEVLDFCGPFEVFSVAGPLVEPSAFRVYTVAEPTKPVLARNGLSVNPHYALADAPPPQILLVPGGLGTRREMKN